MKTHKLVKDKNSVQFWIGAEEATIRRQDDGRADTQEEKVPSLEAVRRMNDLLRQGYRRV